MAGTDAAGLVLRQLATQLAQLRSARDEVFEQVEELVAAHPLHDLLTSMPAVGVRTTARIITEVVSDVIDETATDPAASPAEPKEHAS